MKPESRNSQTEDLLVNLATNSVGEHLEAASAATLTVTCPLSGEEVILQRCAFCECSEGLYLNPLDDTLSLRCHVRAVKKGQDM